MSGLVMPRRSLWLPQWRPMSFAKQFWKGPTGGIARNAGGGIIYDESTALESCCCETPECDGDEATTMTLTMDGWLDASWCTTTRYGGTKDTCRYTFDVLNDTYVTTDLYNANFTGVPELTNVGGLFSLGTAADHTDPGVGPVVTTNFYDPFGTLTSIRKGFVYQLKAITFCYTDEEDIKYVCVQPPGGGGGLGAAFVVGLVQQFNYDSGGTYTSDATGSNFSVASSGVDNLDDPPGACKVLTGKFSKSTITVTEAGTIWEIGCTDGTGFTPPNCAPGTSAGAYYADASTTIALT